MAGFNLTKLFKKDSTNGVQQKIENEMTKEQKKALEKEAYLKNRTLTLGKLFDIACLDFPESYSHLKDEIISDFTTDPRRLSERSVFFYWGKIPMSVGDEAKVIELAQNAFFVISNIPMPIENCHLVTDKDLEGKSILMDAFINASKYIRSIHKAKVITVTGSVGKTSTKEMIESVLRAHYKKPLVSKGNNNSFFAISRNIQSLKQSTNVYLQEVGAFQPHTIEFSAKQLDVDIAVYTNIGQSHLETYGSVDAIACDKLSLSTFGKENGFAVINYDDKILTAHPFKQKVLTYSLENQNAMFYASDIRIEDVATLFTINDSVNNAKLLAKVNALGSHNVLNAVVSYAVGKILKLKDEEILEGIQSYHPSGMRQNIVKANGYTLLCDCYNSSLLAIKNTLDSMLQYPINPNGRRICVLGDVLALGEETIPTHIAIGQEIFNHKIDLFLGYGIAIAHAVNKAKELGINSIYFETRKELEYYIKRNTNTEDFILFKASHGVNLGSTLDRLFGTDYNESNAIGHKEYRLVTEGDFEFYVFENSASLRRYLGKASDVVVPSFVEAEVTDHLHDITAVKQLNVEKIGKSAFKDMPYVKTVTLPNTVVRIRSGAFKNSGLTKFTGPDSLISIGSEAFSNCADLKDFVLSKNTVDLEENVLYNSPNAVLKYK